MVKLILKPLPASTLIEVIISMVMIMAVFTVAIGIYTKVTQSGFSFSRAEAHQQMKKIMHESIESRDWENGLFTTDSIEYKKIVTAYAGYSDMLLITIEANQSGRKIGALSQVIKRREDEN